MSELPGSSSQFHDVRAGMVEMYCCEDDCDWKTSEPANDPAAAVRKVVKEYRQHFADKHKES